MHLRDILWIVFSFIVAVLVFASFKQNVALIDSVLINISIAFAFGFTFDRTLEMATRFKSIYTGEQGEQTPGPAGGGEQGEQTPGPAGGGEQGEQTPGPAGGGEQGEQTPGPAKSKDMK